MTLNRIPDTGKMINQADHIVDANKMLADVLAEIEEKSYETSIFLIIKRDILREILSKYFS
jgi:dsDNA-binding SOS-regulon protein